MEFRPCIDIHNGQVKQIIGSSLMDHNDHAVENFVAEQDAAFYARFYQRYHIKGGHVILLNAVTSDQYQATKDQALSALKAYPGGLQVGGGITPENAKEFLDAGASHVIVTSYVFKDGCIQYDRLKEMEQIAGADRLVLDVSCRKVKDHYRIVTDRWQKTTDEFMNIQLLEKLSAYCDEFLIHAVDVEGKAQGIEAELVKLLGDWGKHPITYAGGVHDFEDLKCLKELGRNKVNVTIGSALDLFGGSMSFLEVLDFIKNA